MAAPESMGRSGLSAIARGSAVHLAGRALARLGSVALLAILTRSLTPSAVGQFAFMMVLGLLLLTLIDFGHSTVATREIAAGETSSSVVSGLYVKLVLAGLTLGLGALVVRESANTWSYLFLWIAVVLDSLRALSLTRARCERRWLTIAATDIARYWGPCLLFVGFRWGRGELAGTLSQSTTEAFLAICLSSIGALLFACAIENRSLRSWSWLTTTSIRTYLKMGFVLFLINLAVGFNNKLDILMLNLLDSEPNVARYAAAYALINGLLLLPRALTFVAFPDLARLHNLSAAERQAWLGTLGRMVTLAATGLGLLLVIVSDPAMRVLYGAEYVGGAIVLVIMAIALPFLFLNAVLWNVLVSQHGESRILRFMLISASLNTLFNLALVPLLSIAGAAIATLFVEIVVFYLALRAVNQLPLGLTVPIVRWSSFLSVILPVSIVIGLRGAVGLMIAGLLAIGAYGCCVFVTGLLNVEDLARARALVSARFR